MRSSELAKLAGVTVRTLRHYHQIGLLAEPARDANGYRRYGVQHLVRLLRIGRLAALGLPLNAIPALLNSTEEPRQGVLDQLDASITMQIEHLQRQRRAVAMLRESDAPLDVPPEFAKALVPLEAGRSEAAIHAGREQSVLLARTTSPAGHEALARLYHRLAEPDLAAIVLNLGQRFDRLDHDTNEAEIVDLANAYIEQLGPWMLEYNAVLANTANDQSPKILWAHATNTTNPAQRQFLLKLAVRLKKDSG